MANEYATSSELKSALSLTGESFADPEITTALAAASRGIDEATNRRFWKDADANQVRRFTPESGDVVIIDDLAEFTSAQADLNGDGTHEITWALTTDFLLWPFNAAADGKPWMALRMQPYSAQLVPVGFPGSVKVTGRFGWPAVPDAVKEATLILAAKLLRRVREAPFGVVTGLDEVAIRIARSDPDVMFLIGPLVRLTV